MPDDRLDALGNLREEGEAFRRAAGSATRVEVSPGKDASDSVSVVLDVQGQVVGVTVVADWRHRITLDGLSDAVIEAVHDAAMQRLDAWGLVYGGEPTKQPADTGSTVCDGDDFQRRLQDAATGPMSAEDRRAALGALLELAEGIERGIDEVSGKLQATLAATHTGRSAGRHVTVTVNGGGDPTAVGFDRAWLREAHDINVSRQITGAFRAAYEALARRGVRQLIADSPLGEVQRATQDPLGLARRLRLTD